MVDFTRTLEDLHDEWESCTKCPLGQRRLQVNGNFVRGEGKPRSVMFIGEGPGVEEEAEGRPFIGRSGKILRGILQKLDFKDFYITNAVTCRACVPAEDAQGNPRFRKGVQVFKDERPLPPYLAACNPRLQEEIYLVDPIVIVALGGTAAETLLGRSVSILAIRGIPEHMSIKGAAFSPSVTDKKGVWGRKQGGHLVYPIEQNEVRYLVLPTLHPAYVARQMSDKGPRSPFMQFVDDIKMAIKVYHQYRFEVFGEVIEETPDDVDVREEFDDEDFDD